MKKSWVLSKIFKLGLTLSIVGCTSLPKDLPYSEKPFESGQVQLVWVGQGRASVFVDGKWVRTPENDYDFVVTQSRHAEYWESLKTMHRRHPKYDGKSGPRDQSLYFRVDFRKENGAVGIKLNSTLGAGAGTSDFEFRSTKLDFKADGLSRFAPFNRYRIKQNYKYEQGKLEETVELFKETEDNETPFVKIDEDAVLFATKTFSAPPTVFGKN